MLVAKQTEKTKPCKGTLMGKQYNKMEKRKRRLLYRKRRKAARKK